MLDGAQGRGKAGSGDGGFRDTSCVVNVCLGVALRGAVSVAESMGERKDGSLRAVLLRCMSCRIPTPTRAVTRCPSTEKAPMRSFAAFTCPSDHVRTEKAHHSDLTFPGFHTLTRIQGKLFAHFLDRRKGSRIATRVSSSVGHDATARYVARRGGGELPGTNPGPPTSPQCRATCTYKMQ